MSTPATLNELFLGALERYGQRPVAMRVKRHDAWQDISYTSALEQVQAILFGLRELGVAAGQHVALLSENRPEWAFADYACLLNRCADVPVYPTLPAGQISYILRDSGAVAIFVSSRSQLEKILSIRNPDVLPNLRHIIAFDDDATGPGVMPLGDLMKRGREAAAKHANWREEALRARADDLATLIYTSGTTGDPKGVMLTHGNLTTNVLSASQMVLLVDGDEALSFLPLSHVFERMAGHYLLFHMGTVINYAQSIDSVSADMLERRPTVVLSVPRLYEKVYARVLEGATKSPVKKAIFTWARANGEAWADLTLARKPVPAFLKLKKAIGDKLVFSKLRQRVGGRLRFFVSGGAPLSAEIAKFFYTAGLPIYEGYGLTETSPVISVNTPDAIRMGTVGRPMPGIEVRIAPDGEILCRGPNVMKGYYNKPEATREAIDPDGWFHTGDIGEVDADGFLWIKDRKKDIIVTAGGKNIAPQPIENRVKTSRFVLNAVMIGDKRKFPVMLVVPNVEALREWAQSRNLSFAGDEALVSSRDASEKIEREVKKALRDLATFEMPKKILLVTRDFSIESGELTPTLKVKRRIVEKHYQAEIDSLYAGGGEG